MNERASLVEQYAMRGWAVFPCKPGQKQPATRSGLYAGTDDLVKLRFWWGQHDYNIGINCGASGLLVVDLDVEKESPSGWEHGEGREPGIRWWLRMCEHHDEDPFGTYVVATPSGGLHIYYTVHEGAGYRSRNGMIAPLVDIKSTGGYVIAAGSETEAGKYEGNGLPTVTSIPIWLEELIDELDPEPDLSEYVETLHQRLRTIQGLAKDHQTFIRDRCQPLMSTPVGQRNDQLNVIAFGLFCASHQEIDDMIEEQLMIHGLAAGLSAREIRDTLRSAFRAAQRHVRGY